MASRGEDTLVSGSGDGYIELWQWKENTPLKISKKITYSSIKNIIMLDDKQIVAASQEGSIFYLEIQENDLIIKAVRKDLQARGMQLLDNGYIASLLSCKL